MPSEQVRLFYETWKAAEQNSLTKSFQACHTERVLCGLFVVVFETRSQSGLYLPKGVAYIPLTPDSPFPTPSQGTISVCQSLILCYILSSFLVLKTPDLVHLALDGRASRTQLLISSLAALGAARG